MKNLLLALGFLGLSVTLSAQAGSATANSPDSKAVMATLETMAKATIDKDVATFNDQLRRGNAGLITTKVPGQ